MQKFALSSLHARSAGGTDTTKSGCCARFRLHAYIKVTILRSTISAIRTRSTVWCSLTFALLIRSLALAVTSATIRICAADISYSECSLSYDVAAATASVRWRLQDTPTIVDGG